MSRQRFEISVINAAPTRFRGLASVDLYNPVAGVREIRRWVEDVLLDFPELVIVAGHVGFPWIDELVTLTVKFQNFYVDTSAYALHRLPPAFVAWMKGIGKNRVMFGTNWPMLSPRKCLEGD